MLNVTVEINKLTAIKTLKLSFIVVKLVKMGFTVIANTPVANV